jgi:hypothetical protein
MRIGEINPSNYADYQKLLGYKRIPGLDDKPNTSLKKAVDPRDFIAPGMDITGTTIEDRRIVDVSDEIRNKVVIHARSEFINNYGMSDGEELSSIIKKYLENVPVSKKVDTAYTLRLIFREESRALTDRVKANNPTWENGQPFDRNILADENVRINNFDVKV